jgi:hypothetical protein
MTANANITAPMGNASVTSSQRLSRSAAAHAARYFNAAAAFDASPATVLPYHRKRSLIFNERNNHMFKTEGTFADMMAQYEAANLDMRVSQVLLEDENNDLDRNIYDAIQEVFDAKVSFCHQLALVLVKAPASSLAELRAKVRFMKAYQMDLTPSREGNAYDEILADLERLT